MILLPVLWDSSHQNLLRSDNVDVYVIGHSEENIKMIKNNTIGIRIMIPMIFNIKNSILIYLPHKNMLLHPQVLLYDTDH